MPLKDFGEGGGPAWVVMASVANGTPCPTILAVSSMPDRVGRDADNAGDISVEYDGEGVSGPVGESCAPAAKGF